MSNRMRRAICVAGLTVAWSGLFPLQASGWRLDRTFGSDGEVRVSAGHLTEARAQSVLELPDGNLLLVGRASTPSGDRVALAEVDGIGAPVRTFGHDGWAVLPLPATRGRLPAPDARLLPGGEIQVIASAGAFRVDRNGTPVTTFGRNGRMMGRTFPLESPNIAVDDGGGLILASARPGIAFARVDAQGRLDEAFARRAADTLKKRGLRRVLGITGEPAGTALVLARGSFDRPMQLIALDASGRLDTAFASDGAAMLDPPPRDALVYERGLLVRLSDGRMLVPATVNARTVIARLTLTGSVDTTFGAHGRAVIDQHSGRSRPAVEAIQELVDGAIGVMVEDALGTRRVVRLNVTGELDRHYGGSGSIVPEPEGGNLRDPVPGVLRDGSVVLPMDAPIGSGGGHGFAFSRIDPLGMGDPQTPIGPAVGVSGGNGLLGSYVPHADGTLSMLGTLSDDTAGSHGAVLRLSARGEVLQDWGANGIATIAGMTEVQRLVRLQGGAWGAGGLECALTSDICKLGVARLDARGAMTATLETTFHACGLQEVLLVPRRDGGLVAVNCGRSFVITRGWTSITRDLAWHVRITGERRLLALSSEGRSALVAGTDGRLRRHFRSNAVDPSYRPLRLPDGALEHITRLPDGGLALVGFERGRIVRLLLDADGHLVSRVTQHAPPWLGDGGDFRIVAGPRLFQDEVRGGVRILRSARVG